MSEANTQGHMSGRKKGNEDLKLRGQVLIRDLDFKAKYL